LLRGRFGDEDESGHPRFEHNRIVRIQVHDNPFTDAADIANALAHDSSAKVIDSWGNGDWPSRAGRSFDIFDARADDAQNAAAHGFDFGEFGHEWSRRLNDTPVCVGRREGEGCVGSGVKRARHAASLSKLGFRKRAERPVTLVGFREKNQNQRQEIPP